MLRIIRMRSVCIVKIRVCFTGQLEAVYKSKVKQQRENYSDNFAYETIFIRFFVAVPGSLSLLDALVSTDSAR